MADNDANSAIDQTKKEILKAITRGLNVTANAGHIRDLAAAYSLLDGKLAPSMERPFPRAQQIPSAK